MCIQFCSSTCAIYIHIKNTVIVDLFLRFLRVPFPYQIDTWVRSVPVCVATVCSKFLLTSFRLDVLQVLGLKVRTLSILQNPDRHQTRGSVVRTKFRQSGEEDMRKIPLEIEEKTPFKGISIVSNLGQVTTFPSNLLKQNQIQGGILPGLRS